MGNQLDTDDPAERTQAALLAAQFGRTRRGLGGRLVGITDDEYFWEPVPGCWNVRRREDAVGSESEGRGDWIFDYADYEETPSPPNIIWRWLVRFGFRGGQRPRRAVGLFRMW